MLKITHNIEDYKIIRKVHHLDYEYILAKKDNQFYSISLYHRHRIQPPPYSIRKLDNHDIDRLKTLKKIEFINLISALHINPNHKKRR